jgi:hypothetical protein
MSTLPTSDVLRTTQRDAPTDQRAASTLIDLIELHAHDDPGVREFDPEALSILDDDAVRLRERAAANRDATSDGQLFGHGVHIRSLVVHGPDILLRVNPTGDKFDHFVAVFGTPILRRDNDLRLEKSRPHWRPSFRLGDV